MSALPVGPFDPSRYVGTVCHVTPLTVDINLPRGACPNGSHYAGYAMQAGQVGEFLFVEGEDHAVLGRLIEIRLPERERLSVEPTANVGSEANPLGVVQLLTALDLATGKPAKGIPSHPRIGQHVFSAHPALLKHTIESEQQDSDRRIELAVFPHAPNTSVALTPEQMFGRHCAILGATGGGKSWTVARLIEEVARLNGKAILFDATGEFHRQGGATRHVHLGGQSTGFLDTREFVSFPYRYLTESDLFVLFRPSGASQAPKLREAIRSLKLAKLEPSLAQAGVIRKANQSKVQFEKALQLHAAALTAEDAEFDIANLAKQVTEECVFPTSNAPGAQWGGVANNDLTYCTSLISRIEADLSSPFMACVYKPEGLKSLPQILDEFLSGDTTSVLRINMEHLPFEHNTRELVTNAVGRYLLRLARNGRFRSVPVVTVLDEAHQFLDKALGDEFTRMPLESFGLIAKEGRKYCLTVVLATQRPRDIPDDVLSQMGMFIVHRLINERDRQVVEKACGNLDASAAAFLPTLKQGEAVLVGVDSPMPLPILIIPPQYEPESHGPNYKKLWATKQPLGD